MGAGSGGPGRDDVAIAPGEAADIDEDSWTARRLDRFAGRKVATGKVLGLAARGWERGVPQDGGVQGVVYRRLPGGRTAVVDLDPGIVAGDPMVFDEQLLEAVWLNDGPAEWGSRGGNLVFGLLDDVSASEVLRDLEALVS